MGANIKTFITIQTHDRESTQYSTKESNYVVNLEHEFNTVLETNGDDVHELR